MFATALVWDHIINKNTAVQNNTSFKQKLLALAGVGLAGGIIYYYYLRNKQKARNSRNVVQYFDNLNIEMVKTVDKCDIVVQELKRRCRLYSALGFDCEWLNDRKGKRRPVGLIQLASHDGYCGLFQLNNFKTFPLSLKDLLEDKTICKVGVAPDEDGNKLRQDYAVVTNSTLDLRYLAEYCDYEPGGLAALTKTILGVVLIKNRKTRSGNWNAEQLTENQIQYAASDAYAGIKIFVVLLENLICNNPTWLHLYDGWRLEEFLQIYTDKKYKSAYRGSANNVKKCL